MTKHPMESEDQQIAVSVPLFLRKLWKMVNDQEAEDIIGWNSSGDGFIIFDQLQFITKLLPKYFKHNNMASFIRQLNFYDFHKVSGIDKDEIQFTHNCFLKDLPETLVFIRRKCTSLRSKMANNAREEEMAEVLGNVKELKTKHALVDDELKMLKQENAALWNEVNSLRGKHAKQTKIINKIIHFLISYMHSHQNPLSKGKVSVGRRNSLNLKTGPTILEIDYHDNSNTDKKDNVEPYFDSEPEHSGAITYPSSEIESFSSYQPAEQTLDEMINNVVASANANKEYRNLWEPNTAKSSKNDVKSNVLVSMKPNTSKRLGQGDNSSVNSEELEDNKCNILYNSVQKKRLLQNPVKFKILHNPKEHLDSYIQNTQVEIESLQDLLNNLNSAELTNFCDIIEAAELENSGEEDNKSDLMNICQEIRKDQDVNNDNNNELVRNSLIEQFDSLPLEQDSMNEVLVSNYLANDQDHDTVIEQPCTVSMPESNLETEQYTVENFDDEPETLVDEYFTSDFL